MALGQFGNNKVAHNIKGLIKNKGVGGLFAGNFVNNL